jgi:hypothetical protein
MASVSIVAVPTMSPSRGWHNDPMLRRVDFRRWLLLAFVGALLLKSAVPLFAAGAAQLRGVGVAEICPLYGVALSTSRQHADHAHHHHGASESTDDGTQLPATHAGDHCALISLGVASLSDPIFAWLNPPPESAAPSARWAARLEHGPPVPA